VSGREPATCMQDISDANNSLSVYVAAWSFWLACLATGVYMLADEVIFSHGPSHISYSHSTACRHMPPRPDKHM